MSTLIDKKFSQYLKTLKDQAAAGMLREVVFSLPEEQRRAAIIKHLPKMTAEDIDKFAEENPNTGFDICNKCERVEPQGSMSSLNNSINCTAFICDLCSESKDTVYNKCSNCDFDMGENYENCAGADDGVCPECGTDVVEGIIKRKEEGQDCTEDESADIKMFIKENLGKAPQDTEILNKLENLFPCEFSEAIEDGDDDCPEVNKKWPGYPIPEAKHEEPQPRIWKVPVLRTGYSTITIDVIATTEGEAIEKAIDEAGGHEFSENDAEYSAPDGAF